MPSSEVIGITGSSGFIGKRLLRQMALNSPGSKVVCFTEPRFIQQKTQFLLEKKADFSALEIELVPCDITRPRLGLDANVYNRLADELTSFFHLAAIYDLTVKERVARKINVGGTQEVLNFLTKCKLSPGLIYYSTCYVAGTRTGTIREAELQASQQFKNHYESTKFEAEVLVREAMNSGLKALILRPSIVCGHSQTGHTDKFDGIYFVMELISLFRWCPFPLLKPGRLEAAANFVPVDFLVDITYRLWKERENHYGKTFHIADPNPPTTYEVFDQLCRIMTGKGAGASIPTWVLEKLMLLFQQGKKAQVPREILYYFNHDSRFECTHLREVLTQWGMEFPRLEKVLPQIHSFWLTQRKI